MIIPVVCFALCFTFQTWEFIGNHNDIARARKLFAEVRAGWVTVRASPASLHPLESAPANVSMLYLPFELPSCFCQGLSDSQAVREEAMNVLRDGRVRMMDGLT